MKKAVTIFLVAVFALTLLASCGSVKREGNSSEEEKKETVEKKENDRQDDLKSEEKEKEEERDTEEASLEYEKPADFLKIDPDQKDPTNDQIKFFFDSDHRIKTVAYEWQGQTIALTYIYKDLNITVYAFKGELLVGMDEFTVRSYDAAAGFTERGGYYFSGCVF